MKSTRIHSKLLVACIAFISLAALLKASYYKPDFFPIGLTGINPTGWASNNCPYGNLKDDQGNPLWRWNTGERQEDDLIFDLGVNCIGCQDAKPSYLIHLDPNGSNEDDYLHKVCENAPDDPIYIITAGFWQDYIRVSMCRTDTAFDTTVNGEYYDTLIYDALPCDEHSYDWVKIGPSWGDHATSHLYRGPYRGDHKGYGDMQLSAYDPLYATDIYNCHGTTYDNYLTFDGDTSGVWRALVDTVVQNFDDYIDNSQHGSSPLFIWGLNLISEDPGIYRNASITRYPELWHGCWAAVDRVLTGHRGSSAFTNLEPASDSGFRGVMARSPEFQSKQRMIVAKCGLGVLHHGDRYYSDFNIFQHLPDIDIIVDFSHGWCKASFNYGDQGLFDYFLYNDPSVRDYWGREIAAGYHNNAIYFQKYGQTHLARSEQERRWIPWLALEWIGASNNHPKCRRPCPPEIRCAAYLLMSRGAKGILFHGWSFSLSDANKTLPNVQIPYTGDDYGSGNVGIRDANNGYPFGYDGAPANVRANHRLNNGTGTTHWHQEANRYDNTYDYLCELIPELKALGPVLVKLDWVNAYSLKSTVSEWEAPGSHMYINWIVPWGDNMGDGYIELAFFDDPDDLASEYFMVVNRDGIAEMDTATLQIAVDGSRWTNTYGYINKLIVKNMADTTDTFALTPSNGYIFTDIFAPGEGKLYRIRGGGGGCIPVKLHLWGEWRETMGSDGYMDVLSANSSLGVAALHCRWHKDKPATLERHTMWKKICSASSWSVFDTFPATVDEFGRIYPMQDSCMRYVAVGEHPDGDTLDSIASYLYGTKSNEVQILHPGSIPSGCPDLYSFMYRDTSLQYGYAFLENNTILPHSEHITQMDDDYLRLDALNTEPDYYYMALVENDYQKTYLDMVKLWVVDHPENTGVVTSADDSIYCYSDEIGPETCTDASQSDQLDKILWEDTTSYGGIGSAYLDVSFDDPGWSNAGLMVTMGMRGYPEPPDKDYYSVPSEPAGGAWDSLGSAYGRMNCSQWVVDVSACDSFRFRVFCRGDDTCFIDRIALVKLEDDYDITEAELDSAVKYNEDGDDFYVKPGLQSDDTLNVELESDQQISLRFDKVDTSTTYTLRNYVFQSHGWYFSPTLQRSSIGEIDPLVFDLEVAQVAPLSRVAMVNYSVPLETYVKIAAYDIAGRLVINLVDGKVQPGRYSEKWIGQDGVGRSLASGVYFIKMMTDEYEETNKIMILE